MARLGLDYETLSARNPRLIYCTEKGFQAGPYENRAALDEVAQMMGGLAYMTGPPGRPLRAGASVIDVQGGMFGALGILAALHERERSGRGCEVVATLYESAVFLVGQHMAQKAVTGTAATPMPARVSAWAVYEAFETSTGEQVFVGVVSDVQWVRFCEVFGLHDLGSNPDLKKNAGRVARRAEFIPKLKAAFAAMTPAELIALCSEAGLPFAPITRPEDLFDDAHLTASGGLLEVTVPDGEFTGGKAALPALPVAIGGARPGPVPRRAPGRTAHRGNPRRNRPRLIPRPRRAVLCSLPSYKEDNPMNNDVIAKWTPTGISGLILVLMAVMWSSLSGRIDDVQADVRDLRGQMSEMNTRFGTH